MWQNTKNWNDPSDNIKKKIFRFSKDKITKRLKNIIQKGIS